MGYIINKEIWETQFKNKLFVDNTGILYKITKGWSKPKVINRYNPFRKNETVEILTEIEVLRVVEGEVKKGYLSNLDKGVGLSRLRLYVLQWIENSSNLETHLKLIQEWEDKEKSS